MTREEQIELASYNFTGEYHNTEFLEGAKWADEHPAEEVQRLKEMFKGDPDAYKQGYKDAVDKAFKWLIERYENQGVVLIDDIHELRDCMEEQQ